MRLSALIVLFALVLAACGGDSETTAVDPVTASTAAPGTTEATEPASTTTEATSVETTQPTTAEGCADVVGVEITAQGDAGYRFDVTVSSPDTGWEKYADAWEVRAPDGTVLGVRELTHPHVDEQPFTRSLSGVEIPADMDTVTVAARDSVEGFCGETMDVDVG